MAVLFSYTFTGYETEYVKRMRIVSGMVQESVLHHFGMRLAIYGMVCFHNLTLITSNEVPCGK